MVRTKRLHQLWERILLNQLFILYFSKKFIENILLIQNPCICKGFYVIHYTIQSCGSGGLFFYVSCNSNGILIFFYSSNFDMELVLFSLFCFLIQNRTRKPPQLQWLYYCHHGTSVTLAPSGGFLLQRNERDARTSGGQDQFLYFQIEPLIKFHRIWSFYYYIIFFVIFN